MAFTFPSSPSVNQTFTINNRTYTWTGTVWEMTGGVITSQQIADSAVTTAKIADGAVVEADIATGAVTETKIGASAVTEAKIGTGAVTVNKIGANAVTQAKLASTLSAITICTSGTRPGSPFAGQAIFETDTNALKVYTGSSWNGVSTVRKVAAFAASGSWTVPAGVTYAVANIRAGGGGAGSSGSGTGGNSSVAFASGTVTATGGLGANGGYIEAPQSQAGTINSGQGAKFNGSDSSNTTKQKAIAQDGAYIVAGADVTPGASISVTVGPGGTAGSSGSAGGSGYVWIEYEQ